MGDREERERAYFALLRAREELSDLERYADHLSAEAQRLRRSRSEDLALRAEVRPRLRRMLRASDDELGEVTARRLALIEDELLRLPARLEAAAAFVAECERHHDVLGGG
jgi:hypothetical protein